MIRSFVGLFVLLAYSICLNAQRESDTLICTASTPLNAGGAGARRRLDNENNYNATLGRKLIAFEGGAAQQWTFETIKRERVKMMFSCEPNGFRVSIYFSKRPCNVDTLNVYRVGFNTTDIPLFQKEKVGPDEIIVQLEGASLQTKIAKCSDMCNDYNAMFQIPQTGQYRLKIIRLRSEWAVNQFLMIYI